MERDAESILDQASPVTSRYPHKLANFNFFAWAISTRPDSAGWRAPGNIELFNFDIELMHNVINIGA